MRKLLVLALGMTLAAALPARGQNTRGMNDYLDGLSALTNQRVDEALNAFNKAIAADDENVSYHTARAIALYVQIKPNEAADDIARAIKLGPTPATQLWGWATSMALSFPPADLMDPAARQRAPQQKRELSFDTRPPYESTEPYARAFIDAAQKLATPQNAAARAQTRQQLQNFATSYAWNEMSGPTLAPLLMGRVKELYDRQKYADCLTLINHLRPKNGTDPQLLYYSAGCKMNAGDCESARQEYTQVLRQWPQDVNSFLGRARAAAMMGSMDRANRDLATAASIDSRATATFRQSIADDLAKGTATVPKQPLADLLANLKAAVAANKPQAQLIDAAEPLMRASAATRFDADEEYTEEFQKLDAAVKANPKSADKQAALAEFLVRPTVVRPVRIPGQTGMTRIPLGDADLPSAMVAINAALAINPKHIGALTQGALAAAEQQKPDGVIQWVQRAFDDGGSNLDLVKLWLDHYTNQANSLAAQAYSLRQPKMSQGFGEGVSVTITTPPSQADLAQAAALDRQSDDLRRKAAAPLQAFISANHNTIDGDLASAEFAQWRGQFDDALADATAALKLDPWNLEAHEFFVDLCPKINKMDEAIQHQDLLNNLSNASSGRTLDKVWDLLAQTKYQSANEMIDQAEKINPAEPRVPAYRAAVAAANKNYDELYPSAHQAVAMEQARARVNGRTFGPNSQIVLSPDDVALRMSVYMIWGAALLQQGRFADAVDPYRMVVVLGRRLPNNQLNNTMQAGALPTVDHQQNNGPVARQLMLNATHQEAVALLSDNKPEDAAKALMTSISINGGGDLPSGAMEFGYQIYQKLGPQKSAQHFTQNMMRYYQMKDGQAQNQQLLNRANQIQADYEKKFEDIQRRRSEIVQKMQQMQTGPANPQGWRDLQNQQAELDREYQQLMVQRNQEQMQNTNNSYQQNQGNSGR